MAWQVHDVKKMSMVNLYIMYTILESNVENDERDS